MFRPYTDDFPATVAGLLRAFRGRERRVPLMLAVSGLTFVGFYLFVEFSRVADDGLGPRYLLSMVVPMVARAALVAVVVLHGAYRIAPPSADDACARKHFPNRKWYRAGANGRLDPW